MKTTEKVLEQLERRAGEYISGEEIAGLLGVSRNAVWKAVKALCEAGHEISSVPRRGYMLSGCEDVISKTGITNAIDFDKRSFYRIEIRDRVTSTNTVLKEEGASGESEGKVLIALSQSEGRGRMGRSFYSPKESGVYLSLLLRPKLTAEQAVFVTTAAAAAVCLAARETFSANAEIKWVNDVYYEGKKICGILTEAVLDLETKAVDYIVLGVGVNVYEPSGGFPEGVAPIAGSLAKSAVSFAKSRIIGRFLSHFYTLYKDESRQNAAELYRKYNFTVGKKINVISGGISRPATALSIDDECRLEVEYDEDGEREFLSAGEISIRERGDCV